MRNNGITFLNCILTFTSAVIAILIFPVTLTNAQLSGVDVTLEIIMGGPDDEYSADRRVDINDHGDMVGMALDPDPGLELLFHYREGYGLEYIMDPGEYGRMQDPRINNVGQISFTGGPVGRNPYRYSKATGFRDLGTLGGDHDHSLGMNDQGQVVGVSVAGGGYQGFRYTDGVGMVNIGSLGYPNTRASDINNNGWITGKSSVSAFEPLAFIYTPENGMQSLGVLPDQDESYAYAINEHGDIMGEYLDIYGYYWDLIYTVEGEILKLDFGDIDPNFYDINDDRWLVGYQTGFPDGWHSMLWTPEFGLFDLNDLIDDPDILLAEAYAINNNGQIVGMAVIDHSTAVYRLTIHNIPAPGGLMIVLIMGSMIINRRGSRGISGFK